MCVCVCVKERDCYEKFAFFDRQAHVFGVATMKRLNYKNGRIAHVLIVAGKHAMPNIKNSTNIGYVYVPIETFGNYHQPQTAAKSY